MGEILTKNKLKKLKTELDGRVKEYHSLAMSTLDFYDEIRTASIDELLEENSHEDIPLIDASQANILRLLENCVSVYTRKLQTYDRTLLKYRRDFQVDPEKTLDELMDESDKAKRLKENLDNIHKDIEESYFRRFMTLEKTASSRLSDLSESDLKEFLECMKDQPYFGLLDNDSAYDMIMDNVKSKVSNGENSFDKMVANMTDAIRMYSNATPIMDEALSKGMAKISFGPGKTMNVDRETVARGLLYGVLGYIALQEMMISKSIMEGQLTPFYHNLDSLEAYYPKKDLNLENLESLLTPDYGHDSKYNQSYKVIKLKKGNKDERNKVKSKIMVKDDKIMLKYLAFGIYGKKIDVVMEYDIEGSSKLLHLDYSDQNRWAHSSGKQFKTYGDFRDISLKLNLQSLFKQKYVSLLGDTSDSINPMMITDDDSRSRLNLAAIGGEALLETDRYIRENYDKIIEAAKKSR